MRNFCLSHLAFAACVLLSAPAAKAALLEDVPFDDVAGTEIENAANPVTGHMFDVDADLAGVTTNGLGQLNASLKSNLEFGTTYIDLDPTLPADDHRIETGTLYGVMELTWDFDVDTFDSAAAEEIRLSLIREDPRSTFVTAEFEITRNAANEVVIFGNAVGTGAVDIPEAPLSLSQPDKFIAVVAVNLDTDLFQVSYSADGGTSFTTLPDGALDPTRGVASIRLTLNEDLSQDNILIDRVYLSDMNPFPGKIPTIPEPSTVVLLGLGAAGLLLSQRRRSNV